jgi:hypothetical protein
MVRAPDIGPLPVEHVHGVEAPLAQASPHYRYAGRTGALYRVTENRECS